MPLAPWAKIAMAVQAVVSLAILGLVIARAVNVFSLAPPPEAASAFLEAPESNWLGALPTISL